jgi:putative ABC transport system ATP-binding protein
MKSPAGSKPAKRSFRSFRICAPHPVLRLEQVSKVYDLEGERIIALSNVTLQVCQGDFIAIVGASGSGKSTFLQVASTLAEPSVGRIFIAGKDTTAYNEVERARLRSQTIGFVFQQFNLLARTSSIDNVALPLLYSRIPLSSRRARAIEELERVGLGNRLHNFPSQLSGGQQQRVAIARALVNHPSVIFADEPTGNLDSTNSGEIKNIFIELAREGKTIIIVTHDPNVACIAKRIIEFQDGQVISDKINKRCSLN